MYVAAKNAVGGCRRACYNSKRQWLLIIFSFRKGLFFLSIKARRDEQNGR